MINYIIMFFMGTIIGSFLNATAMRISYIIENFYDKNFYNKISYFKELLLEITLLKYMFYPLRSECPKCKNKLKWYHNIPIFSYLFLQGKCAYCKTTIPFIYLFSEIIVGFIFVLEYYYYTVFNFPLIYFILILLALSILYIGIVIDIQTMLIPDIFIILAILPLIYINFPLGIDNIKFFVYIFIFAYILHYIQLKLNKVFIGIQDIKLYGIAVLIFGINSIMEILFISSIIGLIFFTYRKIKYNTNVGDFGVYIYISIIIYPLLKIYGISLF